MGYGRLARVSHMARWLDVGVKRDACCVMRSALESRFQGRARDGGTQESA